MRAREGRAEGERGAGGVKVEDGCAGGGDGGLGVRGGQEPGGGRRDGRGKWKTGVEKGGTR